MKKIKLVSCTKVDHKGHNLPRLSSEWFLLNVQKFLRYIFVAFYYYLMPFFILIFQTFLLYAGEIYTQYKKS